MQESSSNLMAIFRAYKAATDKKGQAPTKRADLLEFLNEAGDPEKILRSPDDGEEYVIHWGVNLESTDALVVAYEKTGRGGRRYVLRGHVVFSLTDEELKKVPFPPGYAAPF